MPSGGLMQLSSYGAENLYLTGNPQVTYFKTAYQRHTNFAYEWISEDFDPKLSFNTQKTTIMTVPIKRNGDLVRDVALVVDLPNIYSSQDENFKWINNVGHIFIRSAEFIIGGQSISKLYGQWMSIWYELITPFSLQQGFNQLTGNIQEMTNPAVYYGAIRETGTPSIQKRRLRIPLPFWFTEQPGLAVPLIAIQYTEVSIKFEFRELNDLFTIGIPSVSPEELFNNPSNACNSNHLELRANFEEQGYNPSNIFWKFVSGLLTPGIWNENAYLDIKYVYLDIDERKVFASAVSEYLITQVERLEFRGLQGNVQRDIEFFHPVKEMIWVYQRDDVDERNQWTNYTTLTDDKDYNKFLEIVNLRKNLIDLGLEPDTLNDVHLPSGLTIDEFIQELNYTDINKLSLTRADAFDNYFNIMYGGEFIFNGHTRQIYKTAVYYNAEEPFDTHTKTPNQQRQIYQFSFAESPETIQPSGSANFSMFKDAEFRMVLKERTKETELETRLPLFNMYFYVRNYNVLRIMNGLGGLVFAN